MGVRAELVQRAAHRLFLRGVRLHWVESWRDLRRFNPTARGPFVHGAMNDVSQGRDANPNPPRRNAFETPWR